MFIDNHFTLQSNNQTLERQPEQNQKNISLQGTSPEERWKQEVAMHLHMKNQKKYTHLYQLEKYFR